MYIINIKFTITRYYISRYFISRWIVHQSWSFVQNIVVNYPLVVSNAQRCHLRININHWRVSIISIYIMLFFCFYLCRTLNNFRKLLIIIFKCNKKQTNWPYKKDYVNIMYLYQKLYHFFFKCKNYWNRVGFRVCEILDDYLLEIRCM